MHRRYNLAHLILASVVALVLTPLRVSADEQAQIVFVSERDGPAEIYVMDANGKNRRRLTTNVWEEWDPSWSPDGEGIVFMSDRNDNFWDFGIYVMDADGGNQQELIKNDHDDMDPSWSPNGERIAFVSDRDGNLEIYVMDVDGGNQQRLTKNDRLDWGPSWSPDGERIAFASERDKSYEIYVMDADGGDQRKLTKNRQDDFSPAWFDPTFAVEIDPFAVVPAGKKLMMWGGLKQIDK